MRRLRYAGRCPPATSPQRCTPRNDTGTEHEYWLVFRLVFRLPYSLERVDWDSRAMSSCSSCRPRVDCRSSTAAATAPEDGQPAPLLADVPPINAAAIAAMTDPDDDFSWSTGAGALAGSETAPAGLWPLPSFRSAAAGRGPICTARGETP